MARADADSWTIPKPRIRHNDYGILQPPKLGKWNPRLSVSVVIPAYGAQERIDLVLAGLAAQTYPAELMEVVIADDRSDPPLRIPDIAPDRTRVVVCAAGGWGSSHALQAGVEAAEGHVIHRVDSDMILYRDHVEALMRWHHLADYLCVVGYKWFLDYRAGQVRPREVHDAVTEGRLESIFDLEQLVPSFTEKLIDETDQLRRGGPRAYTVATGATVSFPRRTFFAAGGMNTRLVLGGDTEFAYRVGQTGAVFIPDRDARSIHLGLPEVHRRGADGSRFRKPYVNNLVPLRRNWRKVPGRHWKVPYVDVTVDVGRSKLEDVNATVVQALASSLPDVQVTLVGDWSEVQEAHRPALDDPRLDLRLIHETFRDDGRVRFAETLPQTSFPAPFRFVCPVGWTLHPTSLDRLVGLAEKGQYGTVILALPIGPRLETARLERTAAVRRALSLGAEGERVSEAVHATFGIHWIDGEDGAVTQRIKGKPLQKVEARLAKRKKGRRPLYLRLWTILRRKGASLRNRLAARS